MRIRENITKNWKNIKSFIGWEDYIAIFTSILGLVGYIHGPIPFVPGLTDFYFDIRSELVALGLTVLFIDNVNEIYRRRAEKERLILQMGSPDNGFAIEAVRQLNARKWLDNGSLQRANLKEANLSKVDLSTADLKGAYLRGAQLKGAQLIQIHLENAFLVDACLTGANLMLARFEGANLKGAHLEGAILIDAHITDEQLASAHLSKNTIMRDGSKYDGRFDIKQNES